MKQKSSPRKASSKRSAVPTSRHLHVIRHKHTGHLIHRRTTSYPILVMILLCVGVFLASWTRFVTADSFVYPSPVSNSYSVRASVPGPPPSVAATIASPTEGEVFTSQPITVKGSCPIDTYVTLYRNGAFSGVALCNLAGAYQIQTGLFPGNNKLEVRDFSLTDVAGPLSNAVNVTYNPLVPATPPSTGAETPESPSGQPNSSSTTNKAGPVVNGEPLIFKTTYEYEGHYVGNTSIWQLDIEGGTAPYAISVDWGDGSHSLISRAKAGSFSVDHIYKKVGGYRGSFVTKFTASDADGAQTYLQLLAIVNNPPTGGSSSSNPKLQYGFGSGSTSSNGNNIGGDHAGGTSSNYVLTLIKYIWPSYGLVLLLLFCFWLGERREYLHLKPQLQAVKKHQRSVKHR